MLRALAFHHFSRFHATGAASTSQLRITLVRTLSTERSPARRKFLDIMIDYKTRNYAQTVPSRFIKDMRNATDTDGDNEITMDELKHMLKNIGAEGKITEDELKDIFNEMGVDYKGEKVIHVDDMIKSWIEYTKTG
ncbi:hypothetical protein ACHAWX_006387 [Stephanocyclus meneghinianus]